MATDRNVPPTGITTGEAMELIRQLIVARKSAKRQSTIPVEIVIDDCGEISHVYYVPPKQRLSETKKRHA